MSFEWYLFVANTTPNCPTKEKAIITAPAAAFSTTAPRPAPVITVGKSNRKSHKIRLFPKRERRDTPANLATSLAVIGSRYRNVQYLFQKKLLHAATIQARELKNKISHIEVVGNIQRSIFSVTISIDVLAIPTTAKRTSFTSTLLVCWLGDRGVVSVSNKIGIL